MKKKLTKKEIAFEERMAKQRAKRGYSDRDVWNMRDWFYETVAPMLEQLAEHSHGYIPLDENGNLLPHKQYDYTDNGESEVYVQRWKDTLLYMAHLAREMNPEMCSMQNIYEAEWRKNTDKFYKNYGEFGEKLWTEEEIKRHKETGAAPFYMPEDDPVDGKKNAVIRNKWAAYEKKIERYQNKCKNEFFRLFSKYFWHLWD